MKYDFKDAAGITCNFIKKETLAQVFSCEFCEIFKSTFSIEHLWVTASVNYQNWIPIKFSLETFQSTYR